MTARCANTGSGVTPSETQSRPCGDQPQAAPEARPNRHESGNEVATGNGGAWRFAIVPVALTPAGERLAVVAAGIVAASMLWHAVSRARAVRRELARRNGTMSTAPLWEVRRWG